MIETTQIVRELTYIQERLVRAKNHDERDDRKWNHGAESKHPANSDRPPWVHVVGVRHGCVVKDGESKDKLQVKTYFKHLQ